MNLSQSGNYEKSGIDELNVLASKINNQFNSATDKAKEIYRWIADNIDYDPKQLENPSLQQSQREMIIQALESRKAICQGYSAVFHELCKLCGIRSFVIHGYVQINGSIPDIPHAWNAALIDGKWKLFDPTWGAGTVENGSFSRRFTYDFCLIEPEVSIRSRRPFDPVWQLLTKPVTHHEFVHNAGIASSQNEAIDFNDSITRFLATDSLDQLAIESRRVRNAGLEHKLIIDYYNYLAESYKIILYNREVDKKNEVISLGNSAIGFYNDAIAAYNKYIKAKNNQFRKPFLSDERVRHLISEPDNLLLNSELLINELNTDDAELKNLVGELRSQLSELRKAIDAEKQFVEKYIRTAKPFRMSLFRAY